MSELFNGAMEALARAKEKAAPALENAVEKTMETVADVREKAAPVAEKVADAVKEGVGKVGDLFKKDAPAPDVKNDFFNELEVQAHMQKNAAMAQAEEMQRRLHEMLHGKPEDPKDE